MDDSTEDKKGFMFLGKDISKIPCFRNSFMIGISGGVMTGLLHFMFTSKTTKSSHVGFAGYIAITTIAWASCRSKLKPQNEKEIRTALQHRILTEGTDLGKDLEKQSKNA